ncbi:MAG: hypothetical protein A2233_02880 [Candidatus Kerfeldbacteria bacterium RIFOXYA2_FULL_38_24]|nr:MAG: hypothetical protein A2233_02880 [Candidatus Kerfeldbacteria bacterium RIFOXYA2_FULL_38_24]
MKTRLLCLSKGLLVVFLMGYVMLGQISTAQASGRITKGAKDLETVPPGQFQTYADGILNTQYSGKQTIPVLRKLQWYSDGLEDTFYLSDVADYGYHTVKQYYKPAYGQGYYFNIFDEDGIFGDGEDYDPAQAKENFGYSANTQTEGADVYYNFHLAWDFYKNIFNYTGVDNGKYPGASINYISYIHQPTTDNNTTSSYSYKIGTENDGKTVNKITNVFEYYDVLDDQYNNSPHTPAATIHEFTHAVEFFILGFNENGAMLGEYQKNDQGIALFEGYGELIENYGDCWLDNDKSLQIVPDGASCPWKFGGEVYSSGEIFGTIDYGYPVNLQNPESIGACNYYEDCFDENGNFLSGKEEHQGGGPLERAIYFISEGGEPCSGDNCGDTQSRYIKEKFSGVGENRSAEIAWTLMNKMAEGYDYRRTRGLASQYTRDNKIENDIVKRSFEAVGVLAEYNPVIVKIDEDATDFDSATGILTLDYRLEDNLNKIDDKYDIITYVDDEKVGQGQAVAQADGFSVASGDSKAIQLTPEQLNGKTTLTLRIKVYDIYGDTENEDTMTVPIQEYVPFDLNAPQVSFIGNDTTTAGQEYLELKMEIENIADNIDTKSGVLTLNTGSNKAQLANGQPVQPDGSVFINLADYYPNYQEPLTTSKDKPIACSFEKIDGHYHGTCLVRLLVSDQTYYCGRTSCSTFYASSMLEVPMLNNQGEVEEIVTVTSDQTAYNPYVDKSSPVLTGLQINEQDADANNAYYFDYDKNRETLKFSLGLHDDIAVKEVKISLAGIGEGSTQVLQDEYNFTVTGYPDIGQTDQLVDLFYGPETNPDIIIKGEYSAIITVQDWLGKTTVSDEYQIIIDNTVPTITTAVVNGNRYDNTVNSGSPIANGTSVKFKCTVTDNETSAESCTMKLFYITPKHVNTEVQTWEKQHDPAQAYTASETFLSDAYTLSQEGSYFVEMTGYNQVGMVSELKRLDFTVDPITSAPVITSMYPYYSTSNGSSIGQTIKFQALMTDSQYTINYAKYTIEFYKYKATSSTSTTIWDTTVNADKFTIKTWTPASDDTGGELKLEASFSNAQEGEYRWSVTGCNDSGKCTTSSQVVASIGKTVINTLTPSTNSLHAGNALTFTYNAYNSFPYYTYTLTDGKNTLRTGTVALSSVFPGTTTQDIIGVTAGCSNGAESCTQNYTLQLWSAGGSVSKSVTVSITKADPNDSCQQTVYEEVDFSNDPDIKTPQEVYYDCTQAVEGNITQNDIDQLMVKLQQIDGKKQNVTITSYMNEGSGWKYYSQTTVNSDDTEYISDFYPEDYYPLSIFGNSSHPAYQYRLEFVWGWE